LLEIYYQVDLKEWKMKLKEGTYYTYNYNVYKDNINLVLLAIGPNEYIVILANNNMYFSMGDTGEYTSELIGEDLATGRLKEIDYET